MHKIATSLILLSQGIPFIHSGQEFFRTKNKIENSYKSSDKINLFDWTRMKSNKKYVEYVQDLIKFRKNNPIFRLDSYDEIEKVFKLLKFSKNFIAFSLGSFIILANSSKKTKQFKDFEGEYELIASNYSFSKNNIIISKAINVTSLNLLILKKVEK